MAEEQSTLSAVTEGTTNLIQEAGEKTAQTVIAHTSKYNDAYSTIDKIIKNLKLFFAISLIILFFQGLRVIFQENLFLHGSYCQLRKHNLIF